MAEPSGKSDSREEVTRDRVDRNWAKIINIALAGLVLGLILGWLAVRLFSESGRSAFNAVVVSPTEPMSDFSLTAYPEQTVRLQEFRGKVVMVYFGYTYCPDVCPATMAELARAMDELKSAEREEVQVIMVTVDPARDTPQVLAEYLAHFDPSFVGLSGSEAEIANAAAPFGIYYQKGAGSEASGYLVDHTATVATLDREGYLRLIFHFGAPGEDIAADVRRLLKE
jgi:protein SCO1/2